MVSIAALGSAKTQLVRGLSEDDATRVEQALEYVDEPNRGKAAASGQDAFEFSLGVARNAS